MNLYGMVLVPDTATRRRIERAAARIGHGVIDPARHLPHLTLWQSPMTGPPPITALADATATVSHAARIVRVSFHPGGWYFAHVAGDDLHAAHRRAYAGCAPQIIRRPVAERVGRDLPPTDALAYAVTGYRYAGSAYAPHITVARGDYDPGVLAAWDVALRGREVTWPHSAAVRFGAHGVIDHIFSTGSLAPGEW